MKLQPFAELAESAGVFTEYFKYDGNIEHLQAFLEGTQYSIKQSYRSSALIVSDKGNEEPIYTGTFLIKDLSSPNSIFIWDGCYVNGFKRPINRAKLDVDDPLYGFDVRGWANGLCVVQLKDESFQRIVIKDLLPESKWKDNYLCVILHKDSWIKFKEQHNFQIDDENWKPTKSEGAY